MRRPESGSYPRLMLNQRFNRGQSAGSLFISVCYFDCQTRQKKPRARYADAGLTSASGAGEAGGAVETLTERQPSLFRAAFRGKRAACGRYLRAQC